MFTTLLISRCDIQQKTKSTSGYEKVLSWANIYTSVATRKDSTVNAKINDTQIRVNSDDDTFFFNPEINIKRGNRIVFDSDYYDVIKVNKCYDGSGVHHIEVLARLIDHD